MTYTEHNIVSWHSEIRRFEFNDDSIIDKNIIFFGHSEWYTYLSNITNTIYYQDINIEKFKDVIDMAIFVPSLDLRSDRFSKHIAEEPDVFSEIVTMLKLNNILTVGISINKNCETLYLELFEQLDEVYLIDSSQSTKLNTHRRGLFCSFSYNPLMDEYASNILSKHENIKVIAQNSHIFKNSILLKEVSQILKKDLTVFDYDFTSRKYRLDEKIHDTNFLGKVNQLSYRSLLKVSKIQLFFDENIISDDMLNRQIIENNASYSISLIVSDRKEYFEEIGAIVCNNIYEMLDKISFFLELKEYYEMVVQERWRLVHSKYSIYKFIHDVFNTTLPKITMISPTVRSQNIERILENFYTQTYENKELIIVVNGNIDLVALKKIEERVENRDEISVITLSNDVLASGALNAGIIKAKGDFVFRIDDDDIYGAFYVEDVMLHQFSSNADFLGKKMEYVYLSNENKLLRRKINDKKQTFILDSFSNFFHNIAGNSFALRRSFILENMFRLGTSGYADSDLLISFGNLKEKPLTVYTDTRNLIIIRNKPEEHTWQAENDFFTKDTESTYDKYQWVLDNYKGNLL